MYCLGVDPGESGAAVLLRGRKIVEMLRFKKCTEQEMATWFLGIAALKPIGALEKVRSSPQMGVTSSFTFGWNYGLLRGLMAAAYIPFEDVTPQVWQKGLRIPSKSKKEKPIQFKQRLRIEAHQRWPRFNLTADLADACLIAEWLRRSQIHV